MPHLLRDPRSSGRGTLGSPGVPPRSDESPLDASRSNVHRTSTMNERTDPRLLLSGRAPNRICARSRGRKLTRSSPRWPRPSVIQPACRFCACWFDRTACVCGDIVDELPLAQSTVSQHLKVLKDAGLIRGEVDGPRVCYCIEPRALRRLKALVGGTVGLSPTNLTIAYQR